MKKLIALIIVVTLLCSAALPAFADEFQSLTADELVAELSPADASQTYIDYLQCLAVLLVDDFGTPDFIADSKAEAVSEMKLQVALRIAAIDSYRAAVLALTDDDVKMYNEYYQLTGDSYIDLRQDVSDRCDEYSIELIHAHSLLDLLDVESIYDDAVALQAAVRALQKASQYTDEQYLADAFEQYYEQLYNSAADVSMEPLLALRTMSDMDLLLYLYVDIDNVSQQQYSLLHTAKVQLDSISTPTAEWLNNSFGAAQLKTGLDDYFAANPLTTTQKATEATTAEGTTDTSDTTEPEEAPTNSYDDYADYQENDDIPETGGSSTPAALVLAVLVAATALLVNKRH